MLDENALISATRQCDWWKPNIFEAGNHEFPSAPVLIHIFIPMIFLRNLLSVHRCLSVIIFYTQGDFKAIPSVKRFSYWPWQPPEWSWLYELLSRLYQPAGHVFILTQSTKVYEKYFICFSLAISITAFEHRKPLEKPQRYHNVEIGTRDSSD